MFGVKPCSHTGVAMVGLCAVLSLMAVSAGAVQDGAGQTEQEVKDAAKLARAKCPYAEHMQDTVHGNRRAADTGYSQLAEHLAQAKKRWAEARRYGVDRLRGALEDGCTRMRIAMHRRGPGGGGADERVLRMTEELELTAQQGDVIREARRQHHRASIERKAAIGVAELDLEELMEAPHTADLAAVEQQLHAVSELRVASHVADLRLTQEVWGVLTIEQRDQLQGKSHIAFPRRGNRLRGWSFSGENFIPGIDPDDMMLDG